ncbi:hypothetical protein OsJ_19138 [Oryza sativa Japonica Group]|uniref:Uncharacterized protein n=1 Tax=Oryza sativa subsp. japonica TaxID=39947 RepID=B9FL16_ORYSJ|nr:hypothetical protein OsJ_19138 [Oryza sativa Japonica Group]
MRRSRVRPMQRWCHPCMQQPKPWKEAEEVLSGYGSDVEEQWRMQKEIAVVFTPVAGARDPPLPYWIRPCGGPRAGSAPTEEVVQAPTIHKGMPHVHKIVQTPLHTNWGKKKRKKEETAGRRGHEGDDGELDRVDHGVEDPNGTCGEQVEGVDCRGRATYRQQQDIYGDFVNLKICRPSIAKLIAYYTIRLALSWSTEVPSLSSRWANHKADQTNKSTTFVRAFNL